MRTPPKLMNHSSNLVRTILAFLLLPAIHCAQAQPRSVNSISFQAALNGPKGRPLPSGKYNLTFRFWDGPSPTGSGISTNILVPNVVVRDGVASTPIPVDPAWFSGPIRYVGVTVGNGCELLPRILVTAVPYAINAQSLSNGTIFTDSNGLVGIGTTNPAYRLHVAQRFGSDGLLVGAPEVVNGASYIHISVNSLTNGDGRIEVIKSQGTSYGNLTLLSAGGNVGIGTTTPQTKLEVDGTTRTTVLQISSDRNVKREFELVDDRVVLEKLMTVPLLTWAYTNSPAIRHIGPVAQDFHAAFAVGEDDKHIATVDADGVALAAIQSLYRQLKERDAKITELETRLIALERLSKGNVQKKNGK